MRPRSWNRSPLRVSPPRNRTGPTTPKSSSAATPVPESGRDPVPAASCITCSGVKYGRPPAPPRRAAASLSESAAVSDGTRQHPGNKPRSIACGWPMGGLLPRPLARTGGPLASPWQRRDLPTKERRIPTYLGGEGRRCRVGVGIPSAGRNGLRRQTCAPAVDSRSRAAGQDVRRPGPLCFRARLRLDDSQPSTPRWLAVLGWPHGPLQEHPHRPGDGVAAARPVESACLRRVVRQSRRPASAGLQLTHAPPSGPRASHR